jgi:hypothetical protein
VAGTAGRKRIIAGFWSYAHSDDDYDQGRITRLRDRLEKGIRAYSGIREFRIIQDRNDIPWGSNWAQFIRDSLDDSLIFFALISPSYFSSPACRAEILAFQSRQDNLSSIDLILPIYYLDSELMQQQERSILAYEEAEIADIICEIQYEDWTTLRQLPEDNAVYSSAIERLAQKAASALKRSVLANQKRHEAARVTSKRKKWKESRIALGKENPSEANRAVRDATHARQNQADSTAAVAAGEADSVSNPHSPVKKREAGPQAAMTVYHGTVDVYAEDIETNGIKLAKCRTLSDFGRGFYTMRIFEQAVWFANQEYRKLIRPSVALRAAVVEFVIALDMLRTMESLAFVQPTSD